MNSDDDWTLRVPLSATVTLPSSSSGSSPHVIDPGSLIYWPNISGLYNPSVGFLNPQELLPGSFIPGGPTYPATYPWGFGGMIDVGFYGNYSMPSGQYSRSGKTTSLVPYYSGGITGAGFSGGIAPTFGGFPKFEYFPSYQYPMDRSFGTAYPESFSSSPLYGTGGYSLFPSFGITYPAGFSLSNLYGAGGYSFFPSLSFGINGGLQKFSPGSNLFYPATTSGLKNLDLAGFGSFTVPYSSD